MKIEKINKEIKHITPLSKVKSDNDVKRKLNINTIVTVVWSVVLFFLINLDILSKNNILCNKD